MNDAQVGELDLKPVSIDSKVDEYWGDLNFDINTMQLSSYMDMLKEKYGKTLEIYENLLCDDGTLTALQEKEIYDMEYKSGLYKDYNPIIELHRKEVLKTLTKILRNKTMIDMGCGDGRISLGLALFGNNKMYGIDMNEYAIEIAEQKKKSYPEISDKVKFHKADYNSQEFYEYIKENIPEGADTVLFVQPTKAWYRARQRVYDVLKPEGSAIITRNHILINPNPDLEKMRIEDDWGSLAIHSGMDYNIIRYTPLYKRRAILIGEMRK